MGARLSFKGARLLYGNTRLLLEKGLFRLPFKVSLLSKGDEVIIIRAVSLLFKVDKVIILRGVSLSRLGGARSPRVIN